MHVPDDLDELSQLIGRPVSENDRAAIAAWEAARCRYLENTSEPCESPIRWRLPDERRSLTHRFRIPGEPGLKGYLTMGLYPSSRLGELFLEIAREGSFVSGVLDGLATAISIGLQHGVPLDNFTTKFRGTRFEPAGFVRSAPDGVFEGSKVATSILDYIARYLEFRFPNGVLKTEGEDDV